ncbi:hypothetical protein [Streptosporangium sp. NPDC000396]|uniref:hypothetical protein n=1 Tax=Streptosporangium sp. NPDC000396 TaxID=3366185 RepID=UPI0036784CD4
MSVVATAAIVTSAVGAAGTAQAETVKIPKGFLLTEAEATKPLTDDQAAEEWWTVSDKLARPLELNPCGSKKKPHDGRIAMRTIIGKTTGPSYVSEQVVLYPSVKNAGAVFRKLRADVKRCAKAKAPQAATVAGDFHRYIGKKARIGDEALLAEGNSYERGQEEPLKGELYSPSGERYVVARRGSALILYTADSNWAGEDTSRILIGRAKKMAKKICDLPGVCNG